MLLEYEGNRYTASNAGTLENFLTSKGATNVVDNEDGTLSVTYGGYNFIVDKSTYEVEQDNSLKPKFEIAVSESDNNKKVTITVTISNASDFSKIDSIKLTNLNKNQVVGEKTDGQTSVEFEVASNGDYKVEVTATKDGNSNKGTKTAKVTKIPVTFATNYGTIEVIWLKDKGKTISEKPNEPNMYTGFEKVAWRDDGTEFTPTQNSDWYEYKSISGTGDNTTSHWANAKNTADGSYFVWIPRFAYRIIYWDSEARNNVVGYYDGRGMVDVQGNVIKKTVDSEEITMSLDQGVNKVTQDGIEYIVHPAFDDSVNNGGWREKLSGIWVAKYEMSREDYDSTTTSWKPTTVSDGGGNTEITSSNNTKIRTVSKPNVRSWRNIGIGNCYINSFIYDRTKESHLIKNSEWGATVYLTHSQYGRNGKEVSLNQCTSYITGAGRGNGSNTIYNSEYNVNNSNALPTANQQYNGSIGQLSSSTGNIYGIYDLSGGAYEYVASYNEIDNNNALETSWVLNMTRNVKDNTGKYISTEYITSYDNDGSIIEKVYKIGKVGDASKEIFSSFGFWFRDVSNYFNIEVPFIYRGGITGGESSGLFSSQHTNGGRNNSETFRIVLAE